MIVRTVLDTNVIVSGVLQDSGNPGNITKAALEGRRIRSITSLHILSEVRVVLHRAHIRRRHGWETHSIDLFLERFRNVSLVTSGRAVARVVLEDPSDDKFSSAAIEGNAAYLVSGDRDLLRLGQYQGIVILSPAQFVEEVNL